MLRGRMSAALAAAIFLAAAAKAGAATIVVNTTSGTSPAGDGLCSLSEAVADVDAPGASSGDCAPAAFGANTISLGPHTYYLAPPASGPSALSIASSVTNLRIVGAGEGSTVIDASGAGAQALEIAAGAGVIMSDLTVTGGHAADGAAGAPATNGLPGANGGAILNAGSLTLSDSAVTNSTAGSGGPGGPGVPGGPDGQIEGGQGGPGGLGGAVFNTGALVLSGATISGNRAGNGGAGGPWATATDGSAGFGGSGGNGGDGGGVVTVGGSVTVTASTINANHAGSGGVGSPGGAGGAGDGGNGGSGGGLSTLTAVLSVTNSTFASNVAGNGGDGGSVGSDGVDGVGGQGGSGGALVDNEQPSALLQNVTVAGNNAGNGGAPGSGSTIGAGLNGVSGGLLDEGASPVLRDSLLYLNSGGDCSGPVSDGGHNLSFGSSGCPTTFGAGNPDLGALQDNGGPTRTISLQPGSAAIGAGGGCPNTDQRGVPRPAGKACDIGAYEVAAPKAHTLGPSSVSAHGATLVAQVTPNSGDATVVFQFGRTRKYGSVTKSQQVAGVTASTVTAKVGQLKLNVTYHYRVTVTSMDGKAMGVDRTFTTSNKPVLRSLRLKPARFKVAGTATTIAYTDNLGARTRFTVFAVKPGRRQLKRIGSFTHADVIGVNHVSFSGQLGARRLSPGRYELRAVPRVGRRSGAGRTVKFTVLG